MRTLDDRGAHSHTLTHDCQIKTGWTEHAIYYLKCLFILEQGRYGAGCGNECQCGNGVSCDPFTGVCRCPPGVSGSRCQSGCPSGIYLFIYLFYSWGEVTRDSGVARKFGAQGETLKFAPPGTPSRRYIHFGCPLASPSHRGPGRLPLAPSLHHWLDGLKTRQGLTIKT